jgi:hypothetical protein
MNRNNFAWVLRADGLFNLEPANLVIFGSRSPKRLSSQPGPVHLAWRLFVIEVRRKESR